MIPFWNPWDHRSYLGIVGTIFGHPQNDEEGQKYLLKIVLEDFGCIDADYDIIAHILYIFRNIGTMEVLISILQDFLSSLGLLGRSNMS